jgi:molybdate transport system permease protein
MIVSGNISGKTQTLSTAIYTSIQNGNTSKLIQLSSVSIFLAVITVIIFNFIRKKHNYNNFL